MFGERLKALRKEKGLTQEQLAAIIGVERSSIGKYEGKSKIIPSDDVKYRIAELFGVTVDYLMGYTDNRQPIDPSSTSTDEARLLGMFRNLNTTGQARLLEYCKMLSETPDFQKDIQSGLVI